MKIRIKIDTALLILTVVLTVFLFASQDVYPQNTWVDNILDFLGMMIVLKGTLLRMSARGHKKAYSQRGESLVATGPYMLVRNPMYLGSFLIGLGFVMLVWPVWLMPVFALMFYLRFIRQISEEEKQLSGLFGSGYKHYCDRVPRLFPTVESLLNCKTKEAFNLQETFSTKEIWGLIAWPIVAVILETIQEIFVFGQTDIYKTVYLFTGAVLTFVIVFVIRYIYK